MIGQKILHYNILEKLGEGGMGVVYLAEDTKLERKVAIKFLPRQIAGNSDERKRFEIEAKAAAALNHPNIATIHAIEETDDDLFLVMEYITGKHLKDYINSKPLPVEEAIDIATQISKGLQAAHQKGIVHRDIKSANIMNTEDGQVKIMDFGLAKFRGSAQLTKVGTTLGTAAYMAPEQARGEETDQRADIWSFGAVFYEMLTGHPPFKGEYEQALIYNLLHEDVVPVSKLNQDVSVDINAIISKCLEKEKEQRYQSMDEVLADLQAGSQSRLHPTHVAPMGSPANDHLAKKRSIKLWPVLIVIFLSALISAWFLLRPARDQKGSSKKMMVVLPFINLGNTDDEYFADGLTGEITSKLSGLSGLGVIARSSAMQYKKSSKSLQQIGEELGVQYVLEGTVQWEQASSGKKRVRVNPELIEVENATQIWSKPYEANFANVFELQTNIASTVAEALNLTLISSEKKILKEKITQNSEAYDLYLRAKVYETDITHEENTRIAEKMFKEAISLDENFAAAYAGLSTVQSNMYWEYWARTEENLKNSEANALKALALNPDLPAAYVAMGNYYYHGKLDYESAIHEYKRALELQTENVEAKNGIGFVKRRQGRMREAINYFEETLKLDPRNYETVYSVGETYILLREYDKGLEFLEKSINIAPDSRSPFRFKAIAILLKSGNIEESRKTILDAIENKVGVDYVPFKSQLYLFDILERKYDQALLNLRGIKELSWQFYYQPADLLKGFAYRFSNNESKARESFTSAIKILQEAIKENPNDSRLYTSLGLAYAGIGQKDEAINQGKKGVELLPMEREAWRGSYRLLDLAQIYTMVGEYDLALESIEKLLSSPTDAFGIWLLKLHPIWDPLRNEPGFKKLLIKYKVQNSE